MDTITAVRNRILELCGTHDISINKLANICALPPSSIKNILYGKSQNPKLLTIKMICDGLGITLAHFFDTPEFNALEQEIKEKNFSPPMDSPSEAILVIAVYKLSFSGRAVLAPTLRIKYSMP